MSTQAHVITLWETVCWHKGHLEIKYNLLTAQHSICDAQLQA